jgi:hypothetical protein
MALPDVPVANRFEEEDTTVYSDAPPGDRYHLPSFLPSLPTFLPSFLLHLLTESFVLEYPHRRNLSY